MPESNLSSLPPPEWHARHTPQAVYYDGFCTKLQHGPGPEVIVTAATIAALEAFARSLGFPFERKAVNRVAVMAAKTDRAKGTQGTDGDQEVPRG